MHSQGVTTQDPAHYKGLDVADKGERVYRFREDWEAASADRF